jgi:hypothetical protein
VSAEAIRYQRLPGRRAGVIRKCAAWLAEDHILLVEGTRFHEAYRRVYLSDIQAMIVRRRIRVILSVPLILILPIEGLFIPYMVGPTWGWLPITALAATLLLIIVGALRGYFTGCDLDLATAVGNVRVPSITHTSAATKFAAMITPVITAVQAPAPETPAATPQ